MSETDETAVPEETAASGAEVDAPPAEEAEALAVPAEALEVPVGVTHASVYVCDRGHRTFSVWSTPSSCRAHLNRRDECGRQLYPLGELPEQVQKALNPLKASKKSSKKG
ncbi:MAG: hypothetical protein RIB67_00850 [Miltoncostaeaceae bacterium]